MRMSIGRVRTQGMDTAITADEAGHPATGPRARGRPKTASDAARRAAILAGARHVFLDQGFAGATTEMVAGRCHVSKQTLYRLFPSKMELFRALVVAHRRSMLDLPAAAGLPVADALAAIFRVGIAPEDERERLAFLDLAFRAGTESPEIGEIMWQEGPEASRVMLARWLSDQCAAGTLALDDADSAARMLMDMMFGAMLHPPGRPPEGAARAMREAHMRRCIRIFLDGARPRG